MIDIQLVPQISKSFFRAVIFLKNAGKDIDADISVVFQLPEGREIIFLPNPDDSINYIYPESTSRFVHRIEKGIYIIHSRNKILFSAKKIAIKVLHKGKRAHKEFLI